MIDFMTLAQSMRQELVDRRRDLHRHPELAFEETRTAGIVADELNQLGMEVQTGIGKTGVIGLLDGANDGPTVLVRADMDALPVMEENETEYISTVPGKMHACGHDGHVSIGLAVAKIFAEHRDQINGRIKFVFQPAEELGQGAAAMVADGALENPRPDVSFGLHLWNELPVGKVGLSGGSVMAAVSDFQITVTGKGGHGGIPQDTIDPIVCAAQLVTALQTLVSRNVAPQDMAVVSVTKFHSGTAFNIIPNQAVFGGTIRTFRAEVRDLIDKRMREMTASLCASMGCESEVHMNHHTEPVINNPVVAEKVKEVFTSIVGQENMESQLTLTGEDVGSFMSDVPGAFFFVGAANAERNLNYAHHHSRFDFDEDALPLGAGLLAEAVAAYVFKDE